eukprot:Partr_v1_DN22986_c0_g1_i2_m42472 putative GINS complex subunit 4 (Sld5 homolog)
MLTDLASIENQNLEFEIEKLSSGQQNDMEGLLQAWVAERTTPEIQPFQYEICDSISEQIACQLNAIAVEKGSKLVGNKADESRRIEMMELDLDRAKYLLKSYLRARLDKIEKFAPLIMASSEHVEKLSVPERDFCHSFANMLHAHYFQSTFDRLPEKLHELLPQLVIAPNMSLPVFIRVLDDIGTILLDDEQTLSLEKGCVYLTQYRHISSLLEYKDKIEL